MEGRTYRFFFQRYRMAADFISAAVLAPQVWEAGSLGAAAKKEQEQISFSLSLSSQVQAARARPRGEVGKPSDCPQATARTRDASEEALAGRRREGRRSKSRRGECCEEGKGCSRRWRWRKRCIVE